MCLVVFWVDMVVFALVIFDRHGACLDHFDGPTNTNSLESCLDTFNSMV